MPTAGDFGREVDALGAWKADRVEVSVFLAIRLDVERETALDRLALLVGISIAGGASGRTRRKTEPNGM
jgi:hypothetical protein